MKLFKHCIIYYKFNDFMKTAIKLITNQLYENKS